MKEYFISEIDIEKLYHLSDIKIKIRFKIKRQHLLFDWEEWFRKNIIVVGDRKFLRAINDENYHKYLINILRG